MDIGASKEYVIDSASVAGRAGLTRLIFPSGCCRSSQCGAAHGRLWNPRLCVARRSSVQRSQAEQTFCSTLSNLLATDNDGSIPTGRAVRGLDARCRCFLIYPLIGHAEYGWAFVGYLRERALVLRHAAINASQ